MFYFPPQQKPQRWGSIADVQYAIRKNSEKIYGVDPDSNVLCMPLFWGFPCLDFSGKQNHGTPYGGVAYHSGGLDFDGVDDYVNAPASDTEFLGAITISMRARIDTGGAYRHFAGKHANGGGGADPFDFRTNSSTTPYMWLVRANTAANHWYGPVVALGQTKHYSVTFPSDIAANPTFYIDGVSTTGSKSTGTAVGVSTGSNADIRIGVRADAAVKMDGLISEVRINNIALTAEQIALFHARPWDLYRRVGRTYYSIAAAPSIYIPQIMIF